MMGTYSGWYWMQTLSVRDERDLQRGEGQNGRWKNEGKKNTGCMASFVLVRCAERERVAPHYQGLSLSLDSSHHLHTHPSRALCSLMCRFFNLSLVLLRDVLFSFGSSFILFDSVHTASPCIKVYARTVSDWLSSSLSKRCIKKNLIIIFSRCQPFGTINYIALLCRPRGSENDRWWRVSDGRERIWNNHQR